MLLDVKLQAFVMPFYNAYLYYVLLTTWQKVKLLSLFTILFHGHFFHA